MWVEVHVVAELEMMHVMMNIVMHLMGLDHCLCGVSIIHSVTKWGHATQSFIHSLMNERKASTNRIASNTLGCSFHITLHSCMKASKKL
jgi:hypothetical protein